MRSSRLALLALVLFRVLFGGTAQAATLELISGRGPVPDSFGESGQPAWSDDGRYVAFLSSAPNLVPGQQDLNHSSDVFLHDRVTGTTTLVSHAAGSPTRAASPGHYDDSLGISADGRYVVFSGRSVDLVAGAVDDNGSADVFLWDRVTDTTTLVSHAAGSPGTAGDGVSYGARLSADGSFVAFHSQAGNLVAGQVEPGAPLATTTDVFLWSRASNTATLVSRKGGTTTTTGNDHSLVTGISADGGVVVFLTAARDLLPTVADTNLDVEVYAWQRSTDTLSLVSRAAGSPQSAAGATGGFAGVSDDGRYVVFASASHNLVPGQVDESVFPTFDAFLFDRATGEMRLVSHRSASPLLAGGVHETTHRGLAMSADGRYVAFSSTATDLVPGQVDINLSPDLFVYDRVTGLVELASHRHDSATTAGSLNNTFQDNPAGSPSFSADGRFLVFHSPATDLVPGQTDFTSTSDVFLYDQSSRGVILVSRTGASASTAGNDRSFSPVLSADGSMVAFPSQASNLGAGQMDPYGSTDLFLYRRTTGEITSPTRRDPGLPPPLTPPFPNALGSLSADGRFVTFQDGDRAFLRDASADTTTRLSPPALPPPYATELSRNPVLSADGRFATFISVLFGPSEIPLLGFLEGLYIYDRAAGTYTLVNRAPDSPNQIDGFPASAVLSGDGRYVAYQCSGCGLVPGHPGGSGFTEVFLYDRLSGLNTLVSHSVALPTARADGESHAPAISTDGRYVVFWSDATNLIPGQTDAPFTLDLFRFDRTTGGIELITHVPGSAGTAAGLFFPAPPLIPAELSADGRFIAFQGYMPNLVPGQVDGDETLDVFLRDQGLRTTVLVSHAASSPVTAGTAASPSFGLEDKLSMSADGRYLVYASPAMDLVAGASDTNRARDVFLYDRLTGANSLVSHAGGAPLKAGNGDSQTPRISQDGSRIAFLSAATDLIAGFTPDQAVPRSLYLRDRSAGTTAFIAPAFRTEGPFVPFPPDPGDDPSLFFAPQLSADGRRIAFVTEAPLVPGDYNGTLDVYLWDQDGVEEPEEPEEPEGPIAVTPCRLLDTRRRAERPILTSNVQRTVTAHGRCTVPATAKQIVVKVTVFNPSGKGNLRFYPGAATGAPAGILRFERGTTRTETFTLPLSPSGTLTILPFVANRGTVHVVVEVTAYEED